MSPAAADRRRGIIVGVTASVLAHLLGALLLTLLGRLPAPSRPVREIPAAASTRAGGLPGLTSSAVRTSPLPQDGSSQSGTGPQASRRRTDLNARAQDLDRRVAAGTTSGSAPFPLPTPGALPPQDASGETVERRPRTIISGVVMDADGPVSGVIIRYQRATLRQAEAEVRFGEHSAVASAGTIPAARRRALLEWATRIDPGETYTGGIVRTVTDRRGVFAFEVVTPDTYVVTAERPSPLQIGSSQPIEVRELRDTPLLRPIRLADGWVGPTVSPEGRPVLAGSLAADDPRVQSWGAQRDVFVEKELVLLSWAEAQEIMLSQGIRSGKVYLSGWLTIVTPGGAGYLTRQPDAEAFNRFALRYSLPRRRVTSEALDPASLTAPRATVR